MNVSVTSLSKLISTRKEELARLLEWRGTNFPVVERQNDLRISFIELELEDLEELNNQPQLNENQQIVLEWLKEEKANSILTLFDCIYSFIYGNPKDVVTQIWSELNTKEEAQVLEAFGKWALEQEG